MTEQIELKKLQPFVALGNGKATDRSDIGAIPVYGSNGIIGHTNKSLYENAVILGRVGAYCGSVNFEKSKFWATDNTIVVTPEGDADIRYLYYALHSFPLNELAGGSAQPLINKGIINRLNLPIPVLAIQKKIAAILTAYDDLIENNRQRIALLEKMAEEIYREWFVRLRFPGHENTPVHKGVPEGWKQIEGNRIFDTIKGRSYASSEISNEPTGEGEEHPFITLKSINRGGGYRRGGLKYYRGKYSANQVVQPGDIVMAVTDMTQNRAIVGQVARIPDLAECNNAIISLDIACIRPRTWSKNFLYSFCRFSGFASHLAQFANGANVLHLKPDLIGSQNLLSPPEDLITAFDGNTEPLLNMADILSEQNGQLIESRDLLLNRLISGKLRVDDLDIQLPPSMQEAV